jgi:tetratricopeptide (TPR) repeat protein
VVLTMSEPTVGAEQPWLGLNSFSESTAAWFYGRDDEIAELARRVQRKALTVLFGQSGLGKTSIVRAGLVPRLRSAGYCAVYVRVDYGADAPSPAAQIKEAVFRETLAAGTWTQTGVAVENESLWEFLHHRDDVLLDAGGRPLVPLLIFDQFEEVFTLAQTNDAGRARAAEFLHELADLAENRPPGALEARLEADDSIVERFDFARCDYRILIVLREDYLAHLESLKGTMPSVTQNRMRLARMTGEQALDAVMKPGGALVTREVAEAIVRFVAGGSELRNAEVEPALLSLICRELNAARIAHGEETISVGLLAGSHDTILAEFYERALADRPPGVRRFIEDHLLTDSGFRENLAEERVKKAFAEAGAAPDALATLVDRRLLRVEERLNLRRVELTHDVLSGVVAASRAARREREARDAAQAQLAAEREREAATRRELARARKVAVIGISMAVIAAVAAAFGIWGMWQAHATRGYAEAARVESEKLVAYLLDDFYRELEPFGRQETVGGLAQRALAYYDALPAALRGPDTRRNQALAQVRYGGVLRIQGHTEEAKRLIDAAIATLDDLRAKGDRTEPTAIGLASALTGSSRLAGLNFGAEAALPPAERAVEVLKAIPAAPEESIALRRARAMAWEQLGVVQQELGRQEDAVATLRAALEAYRSVDGLRSDEDAAVRFAIATSWMMEALRRSGRSEESLRLGEEGRRVATQVLQRQPTNLLALRGRARLALASNDAYEELRQFARQLAASDASADDWLSILRVDPTNGAAAQNLGASRLLSAWALFQLGRPLDAVAKGLQDAELQQAFAGIWQGSLADQLMNAAIVASALGDVSESERIYADSRAARHRWLASSPDSVEVRLWAAIEPAIEVELAYARGDLGRASVKWKEARDSLLALDPGSSASAREIRAYWLRTLHSDVLALYLERRDFTSAEQHAGWLLEARRQLEQPMMQYLSSNENREESGADFALCALALAHTGHLEKARELAARSLEIERAFQAQPSDDQWYKVGLARALLASAAVDPPRAKALLVEARSVLASSPPEMRTLIWVRHTEALIDAEAREKR